MRKGDEVDVKIRFDGDDRPTQRLQTSEIPYLRYHAAIPCGKEIAKAEDTWYRWTGKC